MQFDWYSATLNSPPDELVGALLEATPAASCRPAPKVLYGYTHGAQVHLGDTVQATAFWGGVNDGTHAFASGHDAQAFARFMRRTFPSHSVSRADVATDYQDPKAFDTLAKLLKSFASRHKLKTSLAGDWLGKQDGRTLYVGAPSSSVRVRLYEKGRQLDANPDWVRLELVVRPQNPEARAWLAAASPGACWGASRWTTLLAKALTKDEPTRIKAGTVYAPSDDERALQWLVRQYGPLMARLAHQLGGWDRLGPFLAARLGPGSQEGQLALPFDEPPANAQGTPLGQLPLSLDACAALSGRA